MALAARGACFLAAEFVLDPVLCLTRIREDLECAGHASPRLLLF